MEYIDSLCCLATNSLASDLFLHSGRVPQIRINGQIVQADTTPLSEEDLNQFRAHCGAAPDTLDFDGSFTASDGHRYRVNLFRSLERNGAVLRPIKTQVPPLDSLGLPQELLTSWISRSAGLVLVTGATGSGKSTTLASGLDWLNQTTQRHIVTIEDPIEYLFQPQNCLFTQREVGSDTSSFAEGLRRSLRQSPDVILVGEIRDSASAIAALQAAETGHLVLATLHSSSVHDSLERLARLFDSNEREGVLYVLSQQLIGILCQKLVSSQLDERVMVVEHFENQAVTRKWIQEGKFRDLTDFISKGDNPANVTFLRSLFTLIQSKRITEATALQAAPNPQELQRLIRGVSASSIKT